MPGEGGEGRRRGEGVEWRGGERMGWEGWGERRGDGTGEISR